MTNLIEKAKLAKNAALSLLTLNIEARKKILEAISKSILDHKDLILNANNKDLLEADHLSDAMKDRLKLDDKRVESIAASVIAISKQPEVVSIIEEAFQREDGLVIQKQRIPLGLIGIIFESRPNVIVDCSALAIKSSNAVILKGGKEAKHTNQVFVHLIQEAISPFIDQNIIQYCETKEEAQEMMRLEGIIDLIIPRGGEKLIRYVKENSKIPVVFHDKGLCHTFIDASANLEFAKEIVINAKCQRPSVCNALETLLIHKTLPKDFKMDLLTSLQYLGVELRLCNKLNMLFPNAKLATDEDWKTEYLDKILSIKEVESVDDAIEHIKAYGSHHSEVIISQDNASIETFKNKLDAAFIGVNASSRFNDGGELGLGAEIGISTSKLHAYGPMGAKELTTTRYVVIGNGHIRK